MHFWGDWKPQIEKKGKKTKNEPFIPHCLEIVYKQSERCNIMYSFLINQKKYIYKKKSGKNTKLGNRIDFNEIYDNPFKGPRHFVNFFYCIMS